MRYLCKISKDCCIHKKDGPKMPILPQPVIETPRLGDVEKITKPGEMTHIPESNLPSYGIPTTVVHHMVVDFADHYLEAAPSATDDTEERSFEDLVAGYFELLKQVPEDMVDIDLPREY